METVDRVLWVVRRRLAHNLAKKRVYLLRQWLSLVPHGWDARAIVEAWAEDLSAAREARRG